MINDRLLDYPDEWLTGEKRRAQRSMTKLEVVADLRVVVDTLQYTSANKCTSLGGIHRVAIIDLYCIAITRNYLSSMYYIDGILKWLCSLRSSQPMSSICYL
jgi:hypothetical protein